VNADDRRGALARWLAAPVARPLVPLVVVILIGCIFNADGAFFEWGTERAMLREVSVHGILACGMTIVILTAGIDLSVGSVLALSAVCFSLGAIPLGWGATLSIAAALALGLACGAASGALTAFFDMQPFIVTLAMMVFARGLAKLLSGGKKISSYALGVRNPTPPAVFRAIDGRVLGGNVSIVTLIFGACFIVTWILLRRLRFGRYVYAVGGNPEAARLAGVPVRRTLILAYALCGLFAAIAGICQAAQEMQGDPETGMGYELDAIAIVVLGGTSLMGGRGGVGLTLIGALTLGLLEKILSLNDFSTELRLMLTGVIIVGAVLFQQRMARNDR
jgi:ribose transport system permease protein